MDDKNLNEEINDQELNGKKNRILEQQILNMVQQMAEERVFPVLNQFPDSERFVQKFLDDSGLTMEEIDKAFYNGIPPASNASYHGGDAEKLPDRVSVYLPEGFSKWKKKSNEVWELKIGGYHASVEFFQDEDEIDFEASITSNNYNGARDCSTLEEALTWCEESIVKDCAETIRRCGEAKLARFVQRDTICRMGEESSS